MSPLPANVIERTVSPYRRHDYDNVGYGEWLRVAECVFEGVVVAKREYDGEDRLVHEIPLDGEGRRHGLVLEWHESGHLSLAEPFVSGHVHGTAMQWDYDGRYLGNYTLRHGTGFDIWRGTAENGSVYVSEVHSVLDGQLHGFQWWFGEDQQLWHELHFAHGQLHGIEREWNAIGNLRRGAPRYWVSGQRVDKRRYTRAAAADPSLPPFLAGHQRPGRTFPNEVQWAIGGRANPH